MSHNDVIKLYERAVFFAGYFCLVYCSNWSMSGLKNYWKQRIFAAKCLSPKEFTKSICFALLQHLPSYYIIIYIGGMPPEICRYWVSMASENILNMATWA